MLDNAHPLNRLCIMNVIARFRNSLSTCARHTSVSLRTTSLITNVYLQYKCHLQLNVRNRKPVLRFLLATRTRGTILKNASILASPRNLYRPTSFSFRRKGKLRELSLSFTNEIASLIRRGKVVSMNRTTFVSLDGKRNFTPLGLTLYKWISFAYEKKTQSVKKAY